MEPGAKEQTELGQEKLPEMLKDFVLESDISGQLLES